eukprot:6482875-Amphidinium_carterae.1
MAMLEVVTTGHLDLQNVILHYFCFQSGSIQFSLQRQQLRESMRNVLVLETLVAIAVYIYGRTWRRARIKEKQMQPLIFGFIDPIRRCQ